MNKLSLPRKVIKFLKENAGQKFTARQIAEHITVLYPDDFKAKRLGFNTEKEFISQVVSEIKPTSLKENEAIQWQDKPRPRVYWYQNKQENFTKENIDNTIVLENKSEQELYPLLMKYLNEELGLYCLRINEKVSRNSRGPNGNQWLHPDIVAMQAVDQEWNGYVKDCAKQSSGQNVKLWSFEVKVELTGANVRSSFFQAVSNSSWANEGYLVATIIPDHILEELKILSSLHGIGIILLVPDDLSQSEILLPAKRRNDVDWQSVNRIVTENNDFEEYIKYVSVYYKTGEIFKRNWNK